ncbi:MAG: hypothetical protein HOP33_15605 [Verrucomicrobia bacterium]|nr:hypothetical protein [Verrucomicrobiota bacterium]
MRIPAFKQSDRFLGEFDLCCLVATIKNSKLPGVASRHIAEYKEDPPCNIYLRGKDPKKISAWQREMLEQLFEKEGFTTAMAEGMKKYQTNCGRDFYSQFNEEDRHHIKEHGILPFLTIEHIVIDDIGRKVLISADKNDGDLHEHGITICLRNGRWGFEDGDYFSRYSSAFEKNRIFDEEVLAANRLIEWQKRWDVVFPFAAPETHVEANGALLYGVWHIDLRATTKLLKQMGAPNDEIRNVPTVIAQKVGLYFSRTKSEFLRSGYTTSESIVVGYKRKGNWVTMRTMGEKDGPISTSIYWCNGKLLVEKGHKNVFSRVKGSCRKGIHLRELRKRR